MKKTRLLTVALALLLCLCLLFSGCLPTALLLRLSELVREETEEPTLWTEPEPAYTETYAPADVPGRVQNGGGRPYLPEAPVALVPFDEMPYVRPDLDEICDGFARAGALLEAGDPEAVLAAYYEAYDGYYDYYTMDALANVRYSINTNDSYYKEEYDFCENHQPALEEALESFLKQAAESSLKEALEAAYFGEGALDQYLDYAKYTNPDYLALAQREEALLSEYRAALEDPQIDYGGRSQSYWELLERTDGTSEYYGVVKAYLDQYNRIVGKYYLDLLRVRKQLARTMGYDSYAAYAYEQEYGRDYAWEEGKAYIQAVREELVPVYVDYMETDAYYDLTAPAVEEAAVRSALDQVTGTLGGEIREAFEFMMAYGLCDLSQREEKMDTSFEIYFHTYEVPFVMMNAQGDAGDITTFAHEFGHFTDAYVTYNGDEDLETAETFSQSMEYLALSCLGDAVSSRTLEIMREMQLADALEVFISQTAYADFEDRVYALEDSELTLDRINGIYRQVCMDYGFYYAGADFYYSQAWIQVPHFFEAPYYVLSYCLSQDAALQIYQLESGQPGAGLEKYRELLDRTPGDGFQTVLETAGMENPFASGRMREIAAFLRANLPWD